MKNSDGRKVTPAAVVPVAVSTSCTQTLLAKFADGRERERETERERERESVKRKSVF